MRESDILARYVRPLVSPAYAEGMHNDAATMQIAADNYQVISTDMLCEGIHFPRSIAPDALARRALAVNLSDIAAMGALPTHYQLALGLTADADESWIAAFCDGLASMHAAYGVALSGGDTVRGCSAITISITICGEASTPPLTRAGAQEGDKLYVSGTLGDAMLGLHAMQHAVKWPADVQTYLAERFRSPTPRLALGQALRGVASACMDISDGLLIDCQKLCAASHSGALLDYDAIPLSDAARWVRDCEPDIFRHCLSAGDDYELLFTLPSDVRLSDVALPETTAITKIGRITYGNAVLLRDGQGAPVTLGTQGYQH